MPVVAYIANQFPSPVEPYVQDEIRELRRRGVTVVATTARWPKFAASNSISPDINLQKISWRALVQAIFLLICRFPHLADLFARILFEGQESLSRRARCIVHTVLGAYYAVILRPFHVNHIHAHHGYFGSWIALVAARILNAGFSLTLHGSDLLLHPSFLDTKLAHCDLCFTISEYNRTHLMLQFRKIPPEKIIVQHLGVDIAEPSLSFAELPPTCVVLLAIGRLHAVKDHAFLINACAKLRDRGTDVFCLIAGEGPERDPLEHQIATLGLEGRITLLGHVPHEGLDAHYALADIVVLTSRSEGIPLVLMEAMMRGKVVLAPDITGIPELVENGRTGFLYQPRSLDQFVAQIERLQLAAPSLQRVRVQARAHVLAHFERTTNLEMFADRFLAHIRKPSTTVYENPVLQQI